MEGCKSGWVEPLSEETAQEMIKVLNELRTASELEEISNRLADRIFEDILKDIGLNEDIMEEKKTKKMTKAEAFEHLKGTKVLCKDYDKMEAVQDFVRSLGFYWGDASEEMVLTHTLFLHKDGRLSFALSLQYFREQKSPELSADDILSIEIVDENKSEEEKALDKISCLGAQIVDILLRMKGHHHVIITETSVALYDEGMCLFHSDPF